MSFHTVKITLDDGDYFYTKINADEQTIYRYYAIGSHIGIGNTRKITAVELID